jgi:multidrug efflux system outer membrane protein
MKHSSLLLPIVKSMGVVVTLLQLNACVYQSLSHKPKAPVPVDFKVSDAAPFRSSEVSGELWKSFNDPVLDQLISRALSENRTLKQVVSRVEAARAERGIAVSSLFPAINIDANRNSQTPSKLNPLFPPNITKLNTYNAGFDSAWEIDLFGASINAARAAQADLAASEADLIAAKQALIAETAQAYFSLRADQAHYRYAQKRANAARELLHIATLRLQAGRLSQVEFDQIQTQAAGIEATLAPAQSAVSVDINRLMVVTTWSVDELSAVILDGSLPSVPEFISVGNPTDWLARRPDVRAAEQQLRGALARSNVIRSQFFPQITLTGSYGYNAQTAAALGSSASRQWNFGPSISWDFLNIGRTVNQVAAANATTRQALAQFDDTVLRALEETRNGLVQFKAASESFHQSQIASQASHDQLALIEKRHAVGSIDQGIVLSQTLVDCDNQDQVINAQLRQVTALAALYKALAGDFMQPVTH